MRRALIGLTVRAFATVLTMVLLLGSAPAQSLAAGTDNDGGTSAPTQQPIAPPSSDPNTKGGGSKGGGTRGDGDKGHGNAGDNNRGHGNAGDNNRGHGNAGDTVTNNAATTAATQDTVNTTTPTNTTTNTVNTTVGTTANTTTADTTNTAVTANTANTTDDAAAAANPNAANQNAGQVVAGVITAPQGQAQAAPTAVLGMQQLPSTATDPVSAALLATLGAGALGGGLFLIRRR